MISFFKRKPVPGDIIQGDGFEVVILRTNRRKSASIKVKESYITVTVPKWARLSDIELLIAKKSDWIKKQLLRQSAAIALSQRDYTEGEKLYYRGRQLTLSLQNNSEESISIKGEQLIISTIKGKQATQSTKELISNHFKELANQELVERTERFAKMIGTTYTAIRVKQYKSRWGSCSNQGLISYNWRIIIAPDPVIDYIVIHELCHLIEHNHSPRFWSLVGQFSPNYKEQRNWLRKKGLLLVI